MKHQRQGYHECLPTSIAMVEDLPKDVVVHVAELGAGCSYLEMDNPLQAAGAVRAIQVVFNATWFKHEGFVRLLTAPILGPEKVCTILRHKGAAIIFSPLLGSHVVAFERGTVYDPCGDGPEPLPSFINKVLSAGWHFTEIYIKE